MLSRRYWRLLLEIISFTHRRSAPAEAGAAFLKSFRRADRPSGHRRAYFPGSSGPFPWFSFGLLLQVMLRCAICRTRSLVSGSFVRYAAIHPLMMAAISLRPIAVPSRSSSVWNAFS